MYPVNFIIPESCAIDSSLVHSQRASRIRAFLVENAPEASGVYLLSHLPTGETYVGASSCIRSRLLRHFCTLTPGYSTTTIQHLILSAGPFGFEVTVLEFCDKVNLDARELHWFMQLRPTLNRQLPNSSREAISNRRCRKLANRPRAACSCGPRRWHVKSIAEAVEKAAVVPDEMSVLACLTSEPICARDIAERLAGTVSKNRISKLLWQLSFRGEARRTRRGPRFFYIAAAKSK